MRTAPSIAALALSVVLALAAAPAQSQTPAPRANPHVFTPILGAPLAGAHTAAEKRYADAVARLARRFEAAIAAGAPPPRRAETAVAEALNIVADADRGYGGADFPARLEFDACGATQRVLHSYTFYNATAKLAALGVTQPEKITAQALMQVQDANLVAYAQETLPLLAFSMRCMAKSLAPLTAFVASLPKEQMTKIRREGLEKARLGVRQLFAGAPYLAMDARLEESLRGVVLASARESAPALVGAMTLDERRRSAAALAQQAPAAPAWAQADLAAMVAALESKSCESLCAIATAPQ